MVYAACDAPEGGLSAPPHLVWFGFHVWTSRAARLTEFLEHPSQHPTASAAAIDEDVIL